MSRSFWKTWGGPPPLEDLRPVPRDIFGGNDTTVQAPDTTPVAAASEHAAVLANQLGEKQLAEAKRQYDANMEVASPIVSAQAESMRRANEQGTDYYDYWKSFRPAEQAMLAESQRPIDSAASEAALRDAAAVTAAQGGLRAAAEAGDTAVYDANKSDIEAGVGTALADARTGYANNINAALRQGMRYGFSPARLAAMAGISATANASQQVAAANAARAQGINSARSRMVAGAGIGVDAATGARAMRQQNRSADLQDKATSWAKKLDVAGLVRGMPGASTGAYTLANQAGNSAVANQIAPGAAYMPNVAAANGTIMQGQGMKIQGLGSALNAQTGVYNAQLQANAQSDAGLGSALGTLGGALITKYPW